jgi:GT2 family glycosyltransferase
MLILKNLKVYIAIKLSKFPRLFAIAKSVYLLKAQYREQLFRYTANGKAKVDNKVEWAIARQRFISNYLPKKKISEVIDVSSHFDISKSSFINIDICVPVFNRYDLVESLLKEIKKQTIILSHEYSWKFNLMVADDQSTSRTKLALSEICSDLEITHIIQEFNLGVVKNVNSAFQKSNGDIFLLFNSDVQIFENTILAMLKPFVFDESIGIVTAPNFELFDNFIESSSDWISIGRHLIQSSKNSVNYVAACTAVSYAIGIRRSAVVMDELMDIEFGMGYGEDSDLHYQLVSRGWQSVWTLDTIVSHFGGASFGQDEIADGHRAFGRRLFFERWGSRYFSEIDAHEKALKIAIQKRMLKFEDKEPKDLLVLAPSDQRNIGGLFLVNQLIKERLNNESRVGLVILDEFYPRNYDDVLRTLSGPIKWKSYDEILLVGIGSVRWLLKKNIDLSQFSLCFFLQGPDWVIDPDGVEELRFLEKNVKKFLVTGSFTREIALQINPLAKIDYIEPNLKDAEYSGFEETEKTFDFIFSIREEYGKGGHLGISLIKYLAQKYRIMVVSDLNIENLDENVTLTKRSSPREFYKKLAFARVYVDTSLYEGFGLVPRQAMLLKVHCVFFGFIGAPSELLQHEEHFTELGEPYDLIGNVRILENLLTKKLCLGCELCENFK